MPLTHRERVELVLSGERPDRPVVDLGGRVASLSTPAYLDLKAHLGLGRALEGETITMLNTVGRIDERVLERFGVSLRRLYLRPGSTFELKVAEDGSFRDEWGVHYVPQGPYNERVGHPLAGATLDDLDDFPWPDPRDPGRVKGLAEEARRLYEETDYGLAAGHISAGIFQDCWNLRGMAQFLLDMAVDREFAEALLDMVTQVHTGMWEQFLDVVGEYVAVVGTADDLGTQTGLLISPDMYRDLIKPRHAALNETISERTDAKILFHSCGAIMPLVDDLLEIGVEVLNPIQPLPGMAPEDFHARYGGRLVFHGGLDVQFVLPTGSPRDVRAHVRRYLEALGPDRYMMAPANSVQPGTPPENVVTAFDAALSYRRR
jgi:uroporphyrinogen decarboxylase